MKKNLVLHRETIRHLSLAEVPAVRGGATEASCPLPTDVTHWSACGCTVYPSGSCGCEPNTDFSRCVCEE